MGYFGKLRQKRPSLWNNPLLISVPYLLLYFCISYLLYPVAFSSNPPFWEPKAETSIPATVLTGMLTKGVALMYLYIVIDVAILKVPFIRQLLGLAIKRESRLNGKIMILSLLGSILIWYVLDIFYRIFIYKTFPQSLLQFGDAHEFISVVIFIFTGSLVGYILSLYTESRIKAEDKAQESGQLYKTLAEQAAHLGFWSQDLRSGYTTWSDGACRVLGIQSQKPPVDLKILESLVHPDDRADVFKTYIYDGNAAKPHDITYRVVRPDGAIRFVHSIGFVSNDVDGKPTLTFGTLLDITERKQVEELLRESGEKYRSLFENMLNGYAFCKILVDEENKPVDFIYLDVNDAFEKLTGLMDVAGKKVSEVIPGIRESDPLFLEIYGRVASTGIPESFESYFNALGIWLSISIYSPRRDHFVVVFENITERKKADEALRQSEEKHRMLLQNLPQKIFFKDKNSVYISCSENYARALNIKAEEIAGKTDYDFYPKGLAEKYVQDDKKIIETGRIEEIEEEYTQDERESWVHTTKVPVRDEEGNITGLIGIFWDITERKQAREKLEESEAKYRAIIEAASDQIFMVDSEMKILSMNIFAAGLFHKKPEDMVSKSLTEIFPSEIAASTSKNIQEVFETGMNIKKEEALLLGGKSMWTSTSLSPVKDVNGKVIAVIGIARDITERKEIEKGLEKARNELIELVTHDALTGLPNRRLLYDRFDIALASAQRNKKRLAIMSLDLDKFKAINDALGHDVGDKLLVAAADRLTSILRKVDTVARMGGDEFALLLWDVDHKEDAVKVAKKIVEEFRRPFLIDGHTLNNTISLGIAIYPEDGKDIRDLLKGSDESMYRVKESGRDNYKFSSYSNLNPPPQDTKPTKHKSC